MQSRTNFLAKAQFNKDDSKMPWLRTGKTKNGNEYQTLNMSLVTTDNNRVNTELFGMKTNTIKTKDNDGNDIEIDWADRFDESVILSVRNKQVIKLGDDRYEFITPWDFIEFVKEHKAEIENATVQMTGLINKNIYNGKISDRFQIRNLYVLSDEQAANSKTSFTVTEEVFFDKESIDTTDWKEEKKLYINGYVEAYIDKDNGNKYVPRQLVFDCSKVDFENPKHVALVSFRLKNIGCSLEDDKVVVNLKKGYYSNLFTLVYKNGAEVAEFTVDMLTPMQKRRYDMADESEKEKVLNSFRPAGSIYGDRVTMYLVKDFPLTGNYTEGMVKLEDTADEFEESIYVVAAPEKAEDVLDDEEPKKTSKSSDDSDDDDFDLFA